MPNWLVLPVILCKVSTLWTDTFPLVASEALSLLYKRVAAIIYRAQGKLSKLVVTKSSQN